MLAVVQHEPKQGPLLWRGEQTKQGGKRIAEAVEAEVRSAGAHVADQIPPSVFQPVLQPVGDHLGLHVEFILILVVPVLFCWPSPQNLHGFARDPVVLEQVLAQIVHPPAAQPQSFLQQGIAVVLLTEFHQSDAAPKCCEQQHFHFQRCAPHIHGAINHEGAVRNEQHWCAFEAGMEYQVQQQL